MSLPLFAETIPVSESEVQDWLDTVPNLSASTFRREAYRQAYNVEDKIRTAKSTALLKSKSQKPFFKGESQKPF